jgi:hypothetical protein
MATKMPMTDAERQRNRRQRQLQSCDNDKERKALQKALREKYKLEYEKKKQKKMDAINAVEQQKQRLENTGDNEKKEAAPSAKAIRQRHYKKKRENEKQITGLANVVASANGIVEEPIAILTSTNNHKMEGDVVPVYETGQVLECPKTLEGENAMAAMVLEGWSAYIQDNWDSEDVVSVLQMARTSAKTETVGVREITGNRYEFYVRVKGCTPAASTHYYGVWRR